MKLFRNANFPAYVKLIELPQNVGVATVRNNGIKASRGDYIALCDADDVWHPQKLEVQFNYAIKGYTLIGSQAYRFTNPKKLKFKKNTTTDIHETVYDTTARRTRKINDEQPRWTWGLPIPRPLRHRALPEAISPRVVASLRVFVQQIVLLPF